jgi:hypothetical protein
MSDPGDLGGIRVNPDPRLRILIGFVRGKWPPLDKKQRLADLARQNPSLPPRPENFPHPGRPTLKPLVISKSP